MRQAILFSLMLDIQGSLTVVPPSRTFKTVDLDMIDFMEEFAATPPASITWPMLVQYAVACEATKSRFQHLWRQIQDYEAATPSAYLQKCKDNAFDLLWHLARSRDLVPDKKNFGEKAKLLRRLVNFRAPLCVNWNLEWFEEVYSAQISGTVDMIFDGDTVIGLECNPLVS